MKYFKKEDYARVVDIFQGMTLTVGIQQDIANFMSKDAISYERIDVSKKIITTLAKMKLTANNPENSPSWCSTLSDGSQIVWNRKNQQFYHLGSHDTVTKCCYHDWKSLFPEIDWTTDLEWLTDNMYDWQFARRMRMLLEWRQGKINTLNKYVRF